MVQTTPVYGFPYRELGDPPDIPAATQTLAAAIEALLQGNITVNNLTVAGTASLPTRIVGRNKSNAGVSNSNSTTDLKDTGVGDISFTAVSGKTYRVGYKTLISTDTAGSLLVSNVRDGGGSSPTNASTILLSGQMRMETSGGAGQVTLHYAETFACPSQISAGTHTLAAFYNRAAGTGTVVVAGMRELCIEVV